MHNVLICGTLHNFNKSLKSCLKPNFKSFLIDKIDNSNKNIFKNKIDTVIFNCLEKRKSIYQELEYVLRQKFKKIIFLEDAKQIYLNSGNSTPFSVFQDIVPSSFRCKRILQLENLIKKKSLLFLEFQNFMAKAFLTELYITY